GLAHVEPPEPHAPRRGRGRGRAGAVAAVAAGAFRTSRAMAIISVRHDLAGGGGDGHEDGLRRGTAGHGWPRTPALGATVRASPDQHSRGSVAARVRAARSGVVRFVSGPAANPAGVTAWVETRGEQHDPLHG